MEVPKFGSFKPRKKITAGEEERALEKEILLAKRTSHHVDRRQEHDRDHHRRREDGDRVRRRRRDSSKDERKRKSHKDEDIELSFVQECKTADDKSIITTKHGLEDSSLFMIDRRGDSKNNEYGSLHRYSVPAYRRTGYGHLIGHPLSSKIDRETSNEKDVYLIHAAPGRRENQKVARLLSSKYGRNSETRLKFVGAVEAGVEDRAENDFIELSSFHKRKRGPESPEVDGGVDYRSIEGKAKAKNKPVDEDVKYASDSDVVEHDSLDLGARQESAVLSKNAKASPLVLGSWLALAKHQSQLIRPATEPAVFTTSERATLAELRLSILNEAGKHISSGKPGREQLLLATIEEGSPLWDKTKLAAKWKAVLTECPSSILLWARYMDFVQYDHSSFQYETCKDAYMEWLKVLKTAHEVASEEEREKISQTQIYALLRFTNFLRDTGYDELGISVWQILLELHFFAPKQMQGSGLEARLESLEDYWDIETPRIGEEGTLTWSGFHELGPSNTTTRIPVQLPRINLDRRAPFASFAREEATFENRFMLPASTEDEDAMIDPFRCIMFDDLRAVVERLSMKLSKPGLIAAFLHYSGLPPLPCGDIDTQDWYGDPYLASLSNSIKMQNQRQMTYTLFEGAFHSFHDRHGVASDGFARYMDRILESLVQAEPDEGDLMREYYLAFKAKMFPNEAPKAARKLLKSRSASLRLYNAFALIEGRAERMDKALGVWNAALGMLSKLDPTIQDDAVLLWHSRMLMQMDQIDEKVVLKNLLSIFNSAKPSGPENKQDSDHVGQLRLRRDLESGFDRMLLSEKISHAVLYADILAWLTYLTQDLTTTISSYNLHISSFTRSGRLAAVEELQQCKARLLSLHVDRQRPYKPATFQHEINQALQHFPRNSILLQLHSRIASQDRLRSLVTEQKQSIESEMSIVEWSFKLNAEIERVGDISTGGGTVNTVRATFAKALLTPGSDAVHSVALWKAWLDFELRRGDDRRRARNVFLDGLRALPGVKAWAILGMSEGLLEEIEMRRIWEGMVEKGLRVRIGVEEFV